MVLSTELFGFSSMGASLHEYSSPGAAVLLPSGGPCGTLRETLELLSEKSTRKPRMEPGEKVIVLQQGNRTLTRNDTDCIRTTFTPLCLD